MILLSGTDKMALATLVYKRAKVILGAIEAYNRNPHPALDDFYSCKTKIEKAIGKSKKIRAIQNQQSTLGASDQKKLEDALAHVAEALDSEETGLSVLEGNSFRVSSSLQSYKSAFGTPFTEALSRMSASSQWLDGGAGEAKAMIEFLDNGGKGKCTAVGFEIPSGAQRAVADAEKKYDGRFFYASGKFFGQMDESDLHGWEKDFDLITDLNGVLYYTETLAQDLRKYLLLLKNDGVLIFTTNCLGSMLDAPNVDPGARSTGLLRWAANIYGADLVHYRSSNGGTDFCVMRRLRSDVKAPELHLTDNSWRNERPAYTFHCVHDLPHEIQSKAVV